MVAANVNHVKRGTNLCKQPLITILTNGTTMDHGDNGEDKRTKLSMPISARKSLLFYVWLCDFYGNIYSCLFWIFVTAYSSCNTCTPFLCHILQNVISKCDLISLPRNECVCVVPHDYLAAEFQISWERVFSII